MTTQRTGISPENVIVSWITVAVAAFALGVLVGVLL